MSLDPTRLPSGNFDLSHWKLTLPVSARGDAAGVAAEIMPVALVNYTSKWFRTASNGAMVFWAPVDGALTKNADYARSELREMLDPADARVNWTDDDHASLEARCKVSRVPSSTGKVVVGQIHGYDTSPLVKLRYQFRDGVGSVAALVNQAPYATTVAYPLASNIPLSKPFSYWLDVTNRTLSMSVNGGVRSVIAIDPAWAGIGLYFKAGAYVQARGSDPNDGAQVGFYTLCVVHGN